MKCTRKIKKNVFVDWVNLLTRYKIQWIEANLGRVENDINNGKNTKQHNFNDE